ncbi:peptide chain release factor N(5)-glutamine methyltransferase [Flavobacterium haoranii]|uniref:Release factor glutamine methyltransferase n=1 Tax=Flavobacterium haoranii TaxID=683124 RepID=A0A1M6BHS5_9FLAO|nr:peptide chain release factor N(5)-glutamine methyltransferase [Flavobacterium haoranii]SHI48255.1 release factor glutamine methyltransferase [Flavobacterium haoranii]
MKIKELKIQFQNQLENIYDVEEIDIFFFMITEHFYKIRRIDFSLKPDFEIQNIAEWETIISDLKQEKPIQYILGEAWFYGLPFKVNENTLIPRSETEELVEWIIESQKYVTSSGVERTILDIGTGTGCIPISLKTNLPEAEVFAIDISEEALEVAKFNAKQNEVQVNFIQSDILKVEDLLSLRAESRSLPKFDVIVSNPPYVRNLEKVEIKKNVLEYEPHLALFVEDNDALLFYRKIAQLALQALKPSGFLFFEINQYLGKETVEMLIQLGYQNIELRKDLKGNDRMIKCKRYE